MTPLMLTIGAVILAAILIALLVPGGVFVGPILLIAAACWGGYRYAHRRTAV